MMDFLKLRPSAPTAAALAEALDRAKAAETETRHAEKAARDKRDALLLDGEPAQLTAAEKALVTTREDIERAGAIVSALEARHVSAMRAETIGKADAAMQSADAADAELRRWWEKNETSLRRILIEGHRLTLAVSGARFAAEGQRRLVTQTYPDAEFAEGQQSPRDHMDWPETIARLIQHGVSKPRETVNVPAMEAPTDLATGPGALAQGIPASQGGGALASTYIGQASREDAA